MIVLIGLEMVFATTKPTILTVIVMGVTVVLMSTQIFVLIAIVLEVVSSHRQGFLEIMTTGLT